MDKEKLLAILVCPACKGQLAVIDQNGHDGFLCEKCQLIYPIREDIPIMLVEEAIPATNER